MIDFRSRLDHPNIHWLNLISNALGRQQIECFHFHNNFTYEIEIQVYCSYDRKTPCNALKRAISNDRRIDIV